MSRTPYLRHRTRGALAAARRWRVPAHRFDKKVTMILQIDHTALSVPDLDAAEAFYCDLLGFEREYASRWSGNADTDAVIGLTDSGARSLMLKLGGSRIELFEYERPAPRPQPASRPVCDHGITHFCLAVRDIRFEYERLRAAGVPFNSEPFDYGPVVCVYGRDPFDNVFELIEKKARARSAHDNGSE